MEPSAASPTPLKQGLARSVVVEPGSGGDGSADVVVKCFHHPNPLQALRDRARANREFDLLKTLVRLGVPVPRPLEVSHGERGWEVRMEYLADAVSLQSALRSAAPRGAGLVRRLGRLLAALHGAGIDHPDLHPGNVLVDSSGEVWLIDFHKARERKSLRSAKMEADLVTCAAALREHFGARERARALVAWRNALPARAQARFKRLRELAERIEDGARAYRRAVVQRGTGRWLRESGVCELHHHAGGWKHPTLVRRELPPELKLRIPGDVGGLLVFEGAPASVLEQRWTNAARLFEHGVPVAAPVCLQRGAEDWAAFAGPKRTSSVDLDGRAGELGMLFGTLHDRGLDLPRLGPQDVCDVGGRLRLAPPEQLSSIDPRPGRISPQRRWSALGGSAGREVVAGYLRAFAAQPRERAGLETELG